MDGQRRKELGSYYTPDYIVKSLVRWAVRAPSDRLLDPACGDGRFLAAHPNCVGVEQDTDATDRVHQLARRELPPGSLIHEGDFFTWAAQTRERFECAAGNPPFIRYQRFNGQVRRTALRLCWEHGAKFSSLSSSWAPFIVVTATLLKRGGRLAFVVPAEIGHAPYARPVLKYLASRFRVVHVVAVRGKMFSQLSEDCWLLYCEGYGGKTHELRFTSLDQFQFSAQPPESYIRVSLADWSEWNWRLRCFLLPDEVRQVYREAIADKSCVRLRDVAKVGIGYVTGANDFFHLRPSEAARARIPPCFLQPSVRNGRLLTGRAITKTTVEAWSRRDDPMLLLQLSAEDELPTEVKRYLDSPAGKRARTAYKCRTRNPWWAVPDVVVPDAFLSYMCGKTPVLVANRADCVGTNSVLMVRLRKHVCLSWLQQIWEQDFTRLSCEIEGHALGGGMLKLEPGEAARVVLRATQFSKSDRRAIEGGIATLQRWRHYA
jgi:adenine-specific DNA-methyltransferase